MIVRAAWRDGALLARLAFVDRATGAYAPFSPHGAVTASAGRFVRWAPDVARSFARRFLEAGFVPRGGDGFALHDADRAAEIVRTIWPSWDDVEVRLDESLAALAGGGKVDVSVSAAAAEVGDWFDLDVAVFVGGGEPLTREELRALLGAKGRYAEVRGKLVDVGDLRSRQNLLSELTDRRRTGLASLVAMRDELHEAFGDVALPEEVERIRERLRNFEGIEEVEPPDALTLPLRDYQRTRLGLSCVPRVVPIRRHSRRRHGNRQDLAGHRARCKAQARRRRDARARHRADVGDAYVGKRDQEVRAVVADAAAAVGQRSRGQVRDAP